MLAEVLNIEILQDLLAVGTVGFVLGVLMPFGFRLIGYVVDTVRVVLR